ncbi:hypothetical protein [Pseudoduganella namucuonensis]|uniref:hypothetical protein n=1 Tax=Pseudoduganella namucuonensis TaxID=1035707 RepID=UPI00116049FE|nr:hypothetical protein [Pseudoduganella namucuonensis]
MNSSPGTSVPILFDGDLPRCSAALSPETQETIEHSRSDAVDDATLCNRHPPTRRIDALTATVFDRARAIAGISGVEDAKLYLQLKNIPFHLVQRAIYDDGCRVR